MKKDEKENKSATVTSLNDVRAKRTADKFSLPAAEEAKDNSHLTTRKVYEQIDFAMGYGNNTDTGHEKDADGDLIKFTSHHLQSLTAFFNEGKDKGVFYSYDLEEKKSHSLFVIHGVKDETPLRIAFMKVRKQSGQNACKFVSGIDKENICEEPSAIMRGITRTKTEARKRFLN